MARTSRAPTRTSLQLPRPTESIKPLASEPRSPQTANLPLLAPTLHLFARASCSKQRRPPQPNLHSPNSRPAVQCNEGFCNAPERSALGLDYKHSVAETSPLCESESVARAGLCWFKSCLAQSFPEIALDSRVRGAVRGGSNRTVAPTNPYCHAGQSVLSSDPARFNAEERYRVCADQEHCYYFNNTPAPLSESVIWTT